MNTAITWAAIGTGFTFLMTTLGSALVFFFKNAINPKIQRIFLGFAAGVMIAASVWSLLIPAIDQADSTGFWNIICCRLCIVEISGVFHTPPLSIPGFH